MATLTRKGYARIYCENPQDVGKIEKIIKELDEFEYDYLPKDFIAPFSVEFPNLVYTHKFDGLDMNRLTAECWKRGFKIWVLDNGYEKFFHQVKS